MSEKKVYRPPTITTVLRCSDTQFLGGPRCQRPFKHTGLHSHVFVNGDQLDWEDVARPADERDEAARTPAASDEPESA